MKKLSSNRLFEYVLPVLLLIYMGTNTVYIFFFKAYNGIYLDSGGVITSLDVPLPPGADDVRAGDTLVSVGGISLQDFFADLNAPSLWQQYHPGDRLNLTILRDNQLLQVGYTLPTDILPLITNRLASQWFMPYMFFIAGLIGLLFIRPRDERRTLFVLNNFLITIWFSASNLSGTHDLGAQYVLRAAFWLWLPVTWHFHWVFPRSLGRLPAWLTPLIYTLCTFLALAQVAQWVSGNAYLVAFLLAILGSIGLLVTHAIRQPDFRRLVWQVRGLFAVLFIPSVIATLLATITPAGKYYAFIPLTLLGISALPGFYFFLLFIDNNQVSGPLKQRMYRLYGAITILGSLVGIAFTLIMPFFPGAITTLSNLSVMILVGLMLLNFTPLIALPALSSPTAQSINNTALQFRANRLASDLIFVALMLLLGSLLSIVLKFSLPAALDLVSPLLVALLVTILSLRGYPIFQRWFDARALKIPIQPEKLLDIYSERILTALDEATLRDLLTHELLPSWMVRQFALLRVEDDRLQAVITLGISPQQLPLSLADPVEWARLSLPLSMGGKPAGLMLFGRRDPDDIYAANEVEVLQQVTNLTALALTNIKQAAALQELYRSDIERQESERTSLAAELHDDVLQHMASFSMQIADLQATPEAMQTYQYATNRIREITSGLRTPLLAFGLSSSLQGLVDNAQDRGIKGLRFVYEVEGEDVRLDERLELHLYRLVQQALGNALQHAHASQISISGSIHPGKVDLSVSDNGVGFSAGEILNISGLLANKHFGVAGMFERAELIGARMSIFSEPGHGCKVNILWQAA